MTEKVLEDEENDALLTALDPMPDSDSRPVFGKVDASAQVRRRPWLKLASYAALLILVGLAIKALLRDDVRANATAYLENIRPPSLQKLGPGAIPQVQSLWTSEKVMSSSDEPEHFEMIMSSSDEPEHIPGQIPKTKGASKAAPPSPSHKGYQAHRRYDSCELASFDILSELLAATEPTIYVLSEGKVISAKDIIAAPASVCVLVSIPQIELPEKNYTDAPVPGKGPDSIHLLLNSTDVILTFPPLLPLPGQPGASELHTNQSIIYQADTVLYTAGTYELSGEIEFSHWFWAQEWVSPQGKPLEFIPNTGNPSDALYMNMVYNPVSLPSTSITVSGSKDIPSRPACSDKLNAGLGRWYKQSSFPELSSNMTDEWGYTWQGDHCDLTYFTPTETMECFANKHVQFYGDSMIRRVGKAIMTGGTWCSDNLTAPCQDADDGPETPVYKLIEAALDPESKSDSTELTTVSFHRGSHFQHGDTQPIVFGHNTTAYFSFLTQLANSPGLWMDRLYDADDLEKLRDYGKIEPNNTSNVDRAIKAGHEDRARPPPDSNGGHVDLVVLGFGAWDQAFTYAYDDYEEQLKIFRDSLLTAYGAKAGSASSTPIVMRLSNSWCCRPTASAFRRYTGSRICEFDSRTRSVFDYAGYGDGDALDHRVMIVDPTSMNGRPDIFKDYTPSDANHPRASHVRLEMQMLMNSVCERRTDGSIHLRGA